MFDRWVIRGARRGGMTLVHRFHASDDELGRALSSNDAQLCINELLQSSALAGTEDAHPMMRDVVHVGRLRSSLAILSRRRTQRLRALLVVA